MSDVELARVARRFAVLAEPMRLRLLQELMRGERNVNALAAAVRGTQANVSRHLQTLAREGLLSRRQDGLQVIYTISDNSVFDLCAIICHHQYSSSHQDIDSSTNGSNPV